MANVTQATCNKRLTAVLATGGLFTAIAGWALLAGQQAVEAGNSAKEAAKEVTSELKVHTAAEKERDISTERRLGDIKNTVDRIDAALTKYMQEHHSRNNGGG